MRRALAAACRAAAADCGAYDHRCLSTATSTGWLRGAGSGAGAPPQAAAAALARLGSPSGSRGFSAFDEDGDENRDVMGRASDRVKRLSEEILSMSMLEVTDLTEILKKRLGVTGMPMMGMGGAMMPAAAPAAAAAPVESAVPAEEKTEFDIKLTGFDAAAKVKVIKEVRSMTTLGLKEAKELVEKAPAVIKSGVKKEEAEELQKKLEAVGAKISLE
mmetsp:Transcript_14232/g.42998  ORF Transcript_14232/g.42998 Transcript_14232/m.42998 type:complete len:217 (-) Transcript_14232:500-1150(-)